ncbi:MAG: OmpA family protein [Deltaproteobacteria bacterium]|nr:OmpA family protein [Deltaproteobacteria bacterium]
MQKKSWQGLIMAGIAGSVLAAAAHAAEPVAGIDIGAAFPTSTFRKSADPGGAVAPYLGYQWGGKYAVSLLAQPQFAAFGTAVSTKPESDLTSILSLTAGPRLSLNDEGKEVYFSVQGGVYTDISGPLNNSDAGYALAGGFNLDLDRATALGLFLRRDAAGIPAARGSRADVTFVTTGVSLQHRFLAPPPPPPVAAPPLVAELPPPAPLPPKRKIVLRGVNFDTRKAVIRPEDRAILDTAAETLTESGSVAVAVEGHTDSRGTAAANQQLSLQRAEAVRDYLASKGIDRGRMSVAGFAATQPAATNDTDEGRALNRRVELRVSAEP